MAPRPRQTQPPSPPVTLPPPGSAKKGGTVAPTVKTNVTLPPPGSGKKTTTTVPPVGAQLRGPAVPENPLANLDEAELREVIRNANRVIANSQRVGVPTEVAEEVVSTGQRPDAGFRRWINAVVEPYQEYIGQPFASGVRSASGVVGRNVPFAEDVVGGLERIIFGTDAESGRIARETGQPEKRGASALTGAKWILGKPYAGYTYGVRFFTGLIKEASEELALLGDTKRGQQLYYPLSPEKRVPVAGGMFRGGPKEEFKGELGEERGKAGFQWSEVLATARDKKTGFGTTLFRDATGNPYIDQLVGFLGEVFADPVNLLSAGVGGTALKSAAAAASAGPDAFRAAEAVSDVMRLQGKSAIKLEVAKEAAERAVASGDTAAISATRAEVRAATEELRKANQAVLGPQAPRVGGRTGAQSLATRLTEMRNDAQAVLALPDVTPEQAALANYTISVLNDDLIARTASRGFAGLIPDMKSAFRAPSEAEALLGVTGNLRIGLPTLPRAGMGTQVQLPGTGRITRPITYAVGAAREAVGRRGRILLDDIVPTGEGGVFPAGRAEQRASIRAGEMGPEQITRELELEKLDKRFRGRRVLETKDKIGLANRFGLTTKQVGANFVGNIRRVVTGIKPKAGFTRADLQKVLPLVTNRTARAAALPSLSAGERKALDAIQGILSETLREIQDIAAVTGRTVTPRDDYFPQLLSDETLAQLRKSGKVAREVEQQIKVDRLAARGNFIQRELEEGSTFFGRELTADDLAGGVVRLNQIAREGGWKYGNFFEEDVLTAVAKYLNKHADDVALQKTLAEAPDVAPSSFARELRTTTPPPDFDPDRLSRGFAGFARSLKQYPDNAEEIDKIIDVLDINMEDLKVFAARGTYDDAALKNLQDIYLREAELALNFTLTGKSGSLFDLSSKRFADSGEILDRGFISIADSAPEVFASPQVQELFTAVRELKKPGAKEAMKSYYQWFLSFVKTNQLGTPRNVTLNFLGNYYMMTLAGNARTANLLEGAKVYGAIQEGIKAGQSIDDIARQLVARGVADNPQDIVNAYALYGASGFGRYQELAEEIGTNVRTGVAQRGPARGLPGVRNIPVVGPVTREVSAALGGVPRGFRRAGQALEESQRFQFMYDGIKQGLTPNEAAARVTQYLFDYQDLSNLDRVGKSVVPYWMWMSRNTPLQLMVMATRPRAYLFVEKFKRATEQEGAQEFGSETFEPLGPWQTTRGAFVTKEMGGFGAPISRKTIDLGLPTVGFGEKNFLLDALNDPEGALLAPLTPVVRVPLEIAANRIAALKSPIVYPDEANPELMKLDYMFRQSFGMPLSLFSRYIASVPQARRNEVVQKVFDLRYDENQPGDQAFQAAARLFAFPIQPLPRTATKVQTIKSNTRQLEAYIEDLKKDAEADRQKELDKKVKEAEERLKELGVQP